MLRVIELSLFFLVSNNATHSEFIHTEYAHYMHKITLEMFAGWYEM